MWLFPNANLWASLALAHLCAATALDVAAARADGAGLLRPRSFYRDDKGSDGCVQLACDTFVCAAAASDALAVASGGVSLVLGPDCAGWASPDGPAPVDDAAKPCPAGLRLFRGELVVWRAWNNRGKKYKATFVPWENFWGATCHGKKMVECVHGPKKVPDASTGLCHPLVVDIRG